jgi:nicotinamide riboside transporter PnuC
MLSKGSGKIVEKFSTSEKKLYFPVLILVIILTFVIFKSGYLEFLISLLYLSGVMLNTKGIRFWFLFTALGVLIYSYVAFNNSFFSEVLINIFYMIPIQIWGFVKWNKDKEKNTDLKINSLSLKQSVFAGLFIIFITFCYGYFLLYIRNAIPFVSSFSTACSALGATFAAKKN